MSIPTGTLDTIEECARRSHGGDIDFATVVARLTAVGVESYHADYRRGELTYYLPRSESHVVRMYSTVPAIADAFDVDSIRAAVRGAQGGVVKYPEFVQRTSLAGCVGYIVWIAGRHVQYYGRRGEVHVERFPDPS
jgi:uncharacterized protein YbcV (DUF1398 family)